MIKIAVKNTAGKEVKEITLPEFIFGLPSNDGLLHQVYVALTGNQRQPIAHTKDRGERAGSGKKPWRQKGTGRARVGSVRSPLWRKGGVTFGPTKERNFSRETNKKMRQKAVLVALSEKARAGKICLIENFQLAEEKTKHFAELLKKLELSKKSLAVSLAAGEEGTTRLVRNIPKVTSVRTENLSVLELLNREYLLLSPASIEHLEKRFAYFKKKEKTKDKTLSKTSKTRKKRKTDTK